jgi:dephospho-CoA kinase
VWYDAAVSVNHGPDGNSNWSISKGKLERSKIHASEYAWAGTKFDAVLDNNSTLDHLYEQVTRLVQDHLDAK